MDHRGECCCGQLSLVYDGEIEGTSICHCAECQKRSGSAYGVQVRLERDLVTVDGASTRYERRGDSGGRVTFHFCPTCGSTVFWYAEALPDSIIVAAGAFAPGELPAPTLSVYEDRMHSWVSLPESVVERMD
jgi:hypothetical protein